MKINCYNCYNNNMWVITPPNSKYYHYYVIFFTIFFCIFFYHFWVLTPLEVNILKNIHKLPKNCFEISPTTRFSVPPAPFTKRLT